jgi:hypothetical protein
LFEPWLSSIAVGVSDGPVASERPHAVDRAARVKQAIAIRLEERRDIGDLSGDGVEQGGYRQLEALKVPV